MRRLVPPLAGRPWRSLPLNHPDPQPLHQPWEAPSHSPGHEPAEHEPPPPAGDFLLSSPPEPAGPDEVDPEAPAFADGNFQRLHPNHVTVERIGSMIFAGLLGLGTAVAFTIVWLTAGSGAMRPWIVLGAGLFLTLLQLSLAIIIPARSYAATSYAVSGMGLEIRRGIWWKHIIEVPRSRIQHTDVQQGPLARAFGLGKLVVYTAGTQHASVELDGLEHDRALEMRDFLLRGGSDDAT